MHKIIYQCVSLWLIFFSSVSLASNPTAVLPNKTFKVAAIELNPQLMQFEVNLLNITEAIEQAAKAGAKLMVLPEMATSGYLYKDRAQINPFLDTIPGKTTKTLEALAKKYHTYIAIGIAEKDPTTNLAYNAAALIGPNGYLGKYRKNQLNTNDSRWATRGNLGYPIFNTELGKIALLICYDDAYLQSLLAPTLRGAEIIAFLSASGHLSSAEKNSSYNHSTMANITSLSGWVGTYIVASTRTNSETNSNLNMTLYYDGGASVWDPKGKNLATAPVSTADSATPPVTIYADIDPKLYDNPAKQVLALRRPELYQDLTLYRAPLDPNASTVSHAIHAALLQYSPVEADKKANMEKIKFLLEQDAKKNKFNLVVLPEHSLIGTLDPQILKKSAESIHGDTVQNFMAEARAYNTFIVFSMPEQSDGKYYSSVIIIDNEGNIAGVYRKTHLSETDKKWATPGDEIPVFNTALGRIGVILGDEVRIPDISAVLAVKRADLVIIPTSWSGEYGGPVTTDPNLLVKPYPRNTMYMWYNIAKYAQAYTLVANYVGGENGYQGSSGAYSLDPEQAHYIPTVASGTEEEILNVNFVTLGATNWWMNQQYLIVGQRPELSMPLTLDMKSACFLNWKNNSTKNNFCWDE